jgi:hypothetical protein
MALIAPIAIGNVVVAYCCLLQLQSSNAHAAFAATLFTSLLK